MKGDQAIKHEKKLIKKKKNNMRHNQRWLCLLQILLLGLTEFHTFFFFFLRSDLAKRAAKIVTNKNHKNQELDNFTTAWRKCSFYAIKS